MTMTRATALSAVCCALSFSLSTAARGDDPNALPEAGGLTSLPEQTAAAIPPVNGGFEQEWTGWKPAKAEAFSLVEDAAHGGKACLRLDCGQATRYVPGVRQAFPELGPGTYRLGAWVKSKDLGPATGPAAGARLGIEYSLQNGQPGRANTRIFQGTHDWRQVELHFLVSADMKPGSLCVTIHRYGPPTKGEAFFDDLSLERICPPPVEAFLLYPNYRGFLPADGPPRVRIWVRVNDPNAPGQAKVEVTPAGADKTVATMTLPASVKEQVVELDAATWAPGRYLVQAQLGAYRYPAYAVQKITAEDRTRFDVWFDSRQVLHLRGKPTFPIGIYNTLVKFLEVDDAETARLTKMAEAPLNLNINYTVWANDTPVRRRYQEEMRKHGIWFLDTVNNVFPDANRAWDFPILNELLPEAGKMLATQDIADRYLARLAAANRTMPAHAGWYVMDERSFGEVPRHFHQYQVLRKADPGHPTYGVSDKPSELPCWRDAMDVFGLDPYPLFNMKAGRPLSLVAQWTRAGVEATRDSRPVWMVIQFFQGWSADRWPSEEELRTMSLMAVTEGARGLLYWSFGNRALLSVRDEKQREDYWQRLVKVAREIKSLEPALVADDAPQAVKEVSDPRIRWRARVVGGKCYVFAYLPAESFVTDPAAAQGVSVRFVLSKGQTVARTFRPDFADWFAAPME